jgi:nucleoside 2-deoxyribosyltransferase
MKGGDMGTCFVIQPFDRGPFDKRYEDVFEPAISAAGLEPYRVDRDPSVSIPIEDIQSGIRASDVCLAEITTDNPNVWFELGFALASQKPVVLVCSEGREKFPFDVQHRTIITYATDSPRDFETLRDTITNRLKAMLAKEERLGRIATMPPIADFEGLAQHEMATLVTIAENLSTPDDLVDPILIRRLMEKAGFTKIATSLALAALGRKEMIECFDIPSQYGADTGCRPSEKGWDWLIANQDQLELQARLALEDLPLSIKDIVKGIECEKFEQTGKQPDAIIGRIFGSARLVHNQEFWVFVYAGKSGGPYWLQGGTGGNFEEISREVTESGEWLVEWGVNDIYLGEGVRDVRAVALKREDKAKVLEKGYLDCGTKKIESLYELPNKLTVLSDRFDPLFLASKIW